MHLVHNIDLAFGNTSLVGHNHILIFGMKEQKEGICKLEDYRTHTHNGQCPLDIPSPSSTWPLPQNAFNSLKHLLFAARTAFICHFEQSVNVVAVGPNDANALIRYLLGHFQSGCTCFRSSPSSCLAPN